jgi:hypothetical protein
MAGQAGDNKLRNVLPLIVVGVLIAAAVFLGVYRQATNQSRDRAPIGAELRHSGL